MTGASHAVLIRGINVGGKHAVPMGRLRELLTEAGFGAVATYIQSGNVVLDAGALGTDDVSSAVEHILADGFGVTTVVVTVPAATLADVVDKAPDGFGVDDDTFKHDVVFLRPRLDAQATLAKVRLRQDVDAAWAGPGCLYFRRLSAQVTRSYLKEIMVMPEYKDMTIRNWRTTRAVAAMLGA